MDVTQALLDLVEARYRVPSDAYALASPQARMESRDHLAEYHSTDYMGRMVPNNVIRRTGEAESINRDRTVNQIPVSRPRYTRESER